MKWEGGLPFVFQKIAINRSRLRHIISNDGGVWAAKEEVGREFTAYNGDIRRKMHS